MSLTDDSALTGEPGEQTQQKRKRPCLSCGERESGYGQLGNFCMECRDSGAAKAYSGGGTPAPDSTPSGASTRKPPIKQSGPFRSKADNSLYESLKGAHQTVTTLAVMMTNMPALNNPVIADSIDKRADDWAKSAVAVAQENPRVAEILERLMTGGVWAGFAFQTAGSLVFLGTVTGRVRAPLSVIRFVTPELVPLLTVPEPEPAGVV